MGFYYDKEQATLAGGAAYSKYGVARNSKDLVVPQALIDKCGEDGATWFREVAPKTLDLELGDFSLWEEQVAGYFPSCNVLRQLRMSKQIPKESAAYQKALPYLRKMYVLPPENGVMPEDVIHVCLDGHMDESWYQGGGGSYVYEANTAEQKGDKKTILKFMKNERRRNGAFYLSPWKWKITNNTVASWGDNFPTYSNAMKSRIVELYLDIAAMPEISGRTRYQIYEWAAEKLWALPQVEDKVLACRCYRVLGENNSKMKSTYYNCLDWLTWNKAEETLLMLKRLESKEIPEAAYRLGIKYLEGYGCERDFREAEKYFRKGKECDNEEERERSAKMVSYALRKGDCYELYLIAKKKLDTECFEEGMAKLEKLADVHKFEDARYEMGKLLETGYRCQKDEKRARKYYELAAESGYVPAIQKMIAVYEGELLGLKQEKTWNTDYSKIVSKWKYRLNTCSRKSYDYNPW